jgi:hypothetical protein
MEGDRHDDVICSALQGEMRRSESCQRLAGAQIAVVLEVLDRVTERMRNGIPALVASPGPRPAERGRVILATAAPMVRSC